MHLIMIAAGEAVACCPSYLGSARWSRDTGGCCRSQSAVGASSCCWRWERGRYCPTTWGEDGENPRQDGNRDKNLTSLCLLGKNGVAVSIDSLDFHRLLRLPRPPVPDGWDPVWTNTGWDQIWPAVGENALFTFMFVAWDLWLTSQCLNTSHTH